MNVLVFYAVAFSGAKIAERKSDMLTRQALLACHIYSKLCLNAEKKFRFSTSIGQNKHDKKESASIKNVVITFKPTRPR